MRGRMKHVFELPKDGPTENPAKKAEAKPAAKKPAAKKAPAKKATSKKQEA